MTRRAVFTGVARDCAAYLPGVLENLGRFAATYRVIPGPHDQPWLREAGTIETLLWLDRAAERWTSVR